MRSLSSVYCGTCMSKCTQGHHCHLPMHYGLKESILCRKTVDSWRRCNLMPIGLCHPYRTAISLPVCVVDSECRITPGLASSHKHYIQNKRNPEQRPRRHLVSHGPEFSRCHSLGW